MLTIDIYPNNIVLRNSSKKIENYLNNNYERLELQNKKFGKGFVKFYDEVYKLINTKSYNKKIFLLIMML